MVTPCNLYNMESLFFLSGDFSEQITLNQPLPYCNNEQNQSYTDIPHIKPVALGKNC